MVHPVSTGRRKLCTRTRKETDHLEDLGVRGTLKWLLGKFGLEDLIQLTLDGGQWWADVDTALYIWVP